MAVKFETAQSIALAYREVAVAEKLLAEINETLRNRVVPDLRDTFGRQRELELGVPCGNDNSRRLFNVPWVLARPIIEAHIAQQNAIISALSETARIEIEAADSAKTAA